MKRFGAVTACLILIMMLAAGCAGRSALDESFDAAAVQKAAEQVVALANEGDYAGVCALLRADLTDAVTPESLESAWSGTLAQSGGFVELENTRCYGTSDSTTGEAYAVAQVSCRYAHGRRIYTLSFNRDMELVGLYLK